MSAYDYVMTICAGAGLVYLAVGLWHAFGLRRADIVIARGIRAIRTTPPAPRGERRER